MAYQHYKHDDRVALFTFAPAPRTSYLPPLSSPPILSIAALNLLLPLSHSALMSSGAVRNISTPIGFSGISAPSSCAASPFSPAGIVRAGLARKSEGRERKGLCSAARKRW